MDPLSTRTDIQNRHCMEPSIVDQALLSTRSNDTRLLWIQISRITQFNERDAETSRGL